MTASRLRTQVSRLLQCRRQESNRAPTEGWSFELRELVCGSGTLRRHFHSAPRRGIEPRPADSKSAVLSVTLAGRSCRVPRRGFEPRSGPSEGPMLSAAPSGQKQSGVWRPEEDTGGNLLQPQVSRLKPLPEPTTGIAPASK